MGAGTAHPERGVFGRDARLSWGLGPSPAVHGCGDGRAPGADAPSLVNRAVGPGQVATLAGVVHTRFTRADEVTSPRGPGRRLTGVEVDGLAAAVDHAAIRRAHCPPSRDAGHTTHPTRRPVRSPTAARGNTPVLTFSVRCWPWACWRRRALGPRSPTRCAPHGRRGCRFCSTLGTHS